MIEVQGYRSSSGKSRGLRRLFLESCGGGKEEGGGEETGLGK